MSITVAREVKEITVVVSREGKEIAIQPLLSRSGGDGDCECDIDGGSL